MRPTGTIGLGCFVALTLGGNTSLAQEAAGETAAGETPAGETAPAEPEEPRGPIAGDPKPVGLGLSPEAPPGPPAAGGRAISFGAPTPDRQWTLTLGGRFAAADGRSFGRRPSTAGEDYEGNSVHALKPSRTLGKQPYWSDAGFSLFATYGNPTVTGTVSYYARMSGREREGYYSPTSGPSFGNAYLTINPQPLGNLRLTWRVGAFTDAYGGPGQWGWGIYGPLLAIRGYGETLSGEYTYSQNLRLTMGHGVMVVPALDESAVRGDYAGWTESARSTFVQHAHIGFNYQNRLSMNAHVATAVGTDERKFTIPTAESLDEQERANDGRMDVYIVDARWIADPYGELGVAGAFWNFNDAFAVHDGIWWGLDWTQGGREMLNKFVGPQSRGDGQLAALSFEYNLSLARLLWHPRHFDGRSPDIRLGIAGIYHWVVDSADPAFDERRNEIDPADDPADVLFRTAVGDPVQRFCGNQCSGVNNNKGTGYFGAVEFEYLMTHWVSLRLKNYTEKRHSARGPWLVSSISPGLTFRQDWASRDRIEFWYTHNFYNEQVDLNPANPLDKNVVAIAAVVEF